MLKKYQHNSNLKSIKNINAEKIECHKYDYVVYCENIPLKELHVAINFNREGMLAD